MANIVRLGYGGEPTSDWQEEGAWDGATIPTIADNVTIQCNVIGQGVVASQDIYCKTLALIGHADAEVRGLRLVNGARLFLGEAMTITSNNHPAFENIDGDGSEAIMFSDNPGSLYAAITSSGSNQCLSFDGLLSFVRCLNPLLYLNTGDKLGGLFLRDSSLTMLFGSATPIFQKRVIAINSNIVENFVAPRCIMIGGTYGNGTATSSSGCVAELYGCVPNKAQASNYRTHPIRDSRVVESILRRCATTGVMTASAVLA